MNKYIVLIFCLFCFFTSVNVVQATEPKPVFVHFVVLPSVLADGSSAQSAYKTFQAEMIMLAGGYSKLGGSDGGSLHPQGVVPKENMAYLVSSSKKIGPEIKKVVQQIFGIERVFILCWPGELIR